MRETDRFTMDLGGSCPPIPSAICAPEDAPQITFTLSFFSKAVVILEVCLGSLSCWNTALRQSLKGGDHALLHYVTVHVGIHGSLNEL